MDGPEKEPREIERETGGDSLGQHHLDIPDKSTKQSTSHPLIEAGEEDMGSMLEGKDDAESGIYSGSGEPDGGLSEPTELGPRVEPERPGIPEDTRDDGSNVDGPICDKRKPKAPIILLTPPRRRGDRDRRIKSRGMAGKRICEPTPDPDKSDIKKVKKNGNNTNPMTGYGRDGKSFADRGRRTQSDMMSG